MLEQAAVVFAAPQAAQVQEVFDERRLKMEWDDACADETDAVGRKQAVLRKALARWPMIPLLNPETGKPWGNRMKHAPEMRRFVRDVLGMPDSSKGSVNTYARSLLVEGARERKNQRVSAGSIRARQIKNAVAELVTKYRLGADGHDCMEALAKFYEEQTNGKA